MMSRLAALRCLLVLLCALTAAALRPLAPAAWSGAGVLAANAVLGAALGLGGLALERLLREAPLRSIVGGVIGLGAGAGVAHILLRSIPPGLRLGGLPLATDLLGPLVHLSLALSGAVLGAQKGARFHSDGLLARFHAGEAARSGKILDTSVIIDGRIADIYETGFLEGPLIVPQFVLRELQFIADSGDAQRRNRGRKGLDILQRIKKYPGATVLITDSDVPEAREVDQKLIELALKAGACIVTNDLNLNKVAQLRGVKVLNINDLANALRPVILPGETMPVFIVKEGKEQNQGVAYLDDGTMVVVDNARNKIGRTVDVIVTSVLQTTAGKMFFGRCAAETDKAHPRRPREGAVPKHEEDAS
ncbi:MAG TPA: TRAM domain-containing protein [Candidatus Polarisedimenticolia bacterium]|nr:TRAM domain-containing protein [Candidatus Polarisedimenticolia bacterium]